MKTITTNIDYCSVFQVGYNDEPTQLIVDKEIDGSIHRVQVNGQRVNVFINFHLKDEVGNTIDTRGVVCKLYEGEEHKTKQEVNELFNQNINLLIAQTKYEQAGYITEGYNPETNTIL